MGLLRAYVEILMRKWRTSTENLNHICVWAGGLLHAFDRSGRCIFAMFWLTLTFEPDDTVSSCSPLPKVISAMRR